MLPSNCHELQNYFTATHESRDEHVWEDDDKYFDHTDVEVWPSRQLYLIKSGEEQDSPADMKDDNGIGGKCCVWPVWWVCI